MSALAEADRALWSADHDAAVVIDRNAAVHVLTCDTVEAVWVGIAAVPGAGAGRRLGRDEQLPCGVDDDAGA